MGNPLPNSDRATRTTPTATPARSTTASAPGSPYLRAGTGCDSARGTSACTVVNGSGVGSGGPATSGPGPGTLGAGVGITPMPIGGGLVSPSGGVAGCAAGALGGFECDAG